MNARGGLKERRRFLQAGASFLLGTFFGLGALSKAVASEGMAPVSARMALIIDDIGHNVWRARRFLDLGVPMTFAMLPHLAHSHELALEIHESGQELILHQPMEPSDSSLDPGPGSLYVGDRPARIATVLEENITSVPWAVGLNNHMGSRFTSCETEMTEVLGTVKQKGLFFIDSVTSNASAGFETARRLHMPSAYRNVFLDHRPGETAVLSQLHKLQRHALVHGRAIGIGHPHPETAGAIRTFLSGHLNPQVSLVPASSLISIGNCTS